MAAVESCETECAEILCQLSEVVQTTEDPSSFKNSCTSPQEFEGPESSGKVAFPATKTTKRSGASVSENSMPLDTDIAKSGYKDWTRSLTKLPPFTHTKLENKLVKNNRTMPDKVAPKAFRNMKKGYGLWRECYVKNTMVKPNVQAAHKELFLVKARVSASMKSMSYAVYIHLDQKSGEVENSTCNCKAGQGGCCKHVAAVLYTILDFSNLKLSVVPADLTCTQLPQKWNVPSGSSKTLERAVKFEDLFFEKADVKKPDKKFSVRGVREEYCATPPYAQEMTETDVKIMADAFERNGRALLFCEALKSNEYKPCNAFETSCSRMIKRRKLEDTSLEALSTSSAYTVIDEIFENMAKHYDPPSFCTQEQLESVSRNVCLTETQAKEICQNTIEQSSSPCWYDERRKRATASVFGKIINRRKTNHPASLIQSITAQKTNLNTKMPLPLKWGIDNEKNAVKQYQSICLTDENTYVRHCGLVISLKWPWLACSPDGIVVKDGKPIGCIEVKCPYSIRDSSISDAIGTSKTFYLKETENGINLKTNHLYYYQCQGILNILNLNWIDLVVYTTVDMHVERIYKDLSLWETKMLPELTSFYFTFILPLNN